MGLSTLSTQNHILLTRQDSVVQRAELQIALGELDDFINTPEYRARALKNLALSDIAQAENVLEHATGRSIIGRTFEDDISPSDIESIIQEFKKLVPILRDETDIDPPENSKWKVSLILNIRGATFIFNQADVDGCEVIQIQEMEALQFPKKEHTSTYLQTVEGVEDPLRRLIQN